MAIGNNAKISKHRCWTILPLLLAGALAGCATSTAQVSSVAAANATIAEGYRLGSGDKIKLTVFDEPTLSGEYSVGEGGTLAFPLLGQLAVLGQTPGQLADLVATDLQSGGYVLAPRVSVEVLEYRPFYILGEVTEPGEYPYSGELTLYQAVAGAGGFTPRANRRMVEIRRQQWAMARRVPIDEAPLLVAPGDTIMILEAFF